MHNLVLRIEQACLQMNWPVLLGLGLIATALGLFLWLGGLRYSALVLALLGAAVGATLGLLLSRWLPGPTVLIVVIGAAVVALIAAVMQQPIILLLAAIIFALVCGMTYMTLKLNSQQWRDTLAQLTEQVRAHPDDLPDDNSARANLLRHLAAMAPSRDSETDHRSPHQRAMAGLKAALAELRFSASSSWVSLAVWIILGGLVGLAIAFLLKRLIMALCCSIVGSSSVFLGVSAILLAKKAAVLTGLWSRPALAPVVFGVMVGVGLLVQLLFVRPIKTTHRDTIHKEE